MATATITITLIIKSVKWSPCQPPAIKHIISCGILLNIRHMEFSRSRCPMEKHEEDMKVIPTGRMD
jgi:hypothetical protein